MKYTFILFFGLLSITLSGQESFSYFHFANNTDLSLESSYEIGGNPDRVEIGDNEIPPWAVHYFHVIEPPVGFSHTVEPFLFKSSRLMMGSPNSHSVNMSVLYEGTAIFSIEYIFEEAISLATYKVIIPGAGEEPVYEINAETGNDPHLAGSDILINDKEYRLLYGGLNSDEESTYNVLFILDEKVPESLFRDPPISDLSDPTVLNVLSYNPGFLTPLGINDHEETERAKVFHQSIPTNLDIIIFQEFFEIDDEVAEIFSHLDSIYPYRSNRLNLPATDDSIPGIGPIAKDGGVYILSKHPILEEEDMSYQFDCGVEAIGVDALSDKGFKYVKIDKLGTIIHVFGTHTYGMAASEVPCALDFILDKTGTNTQDIVLIGGDFNYHYNGEDYSYMRSDFKVTEPDFYSYEDSIYAGTTWYHNHYSGGTGGANYIDYIMPLQYGRHPIWQFNETQVYRNRSLLPESWGVLDFGDHNPVFGSFRFPVISSQTKTVEICEGGEIDMFVEVNGEMSYQWFKDGEVLEGAILPSLNIASGDVSDAGIYQCAMTYYYEADTNINQIAMASHGGYDSQGKLWDTLYSKAIPVVVLDSDPDPFVYWSGDTLFSSYQTGNQWYGTMGLLADETGPFLIPDVDDTYFTVVQLNGCAIDTSESIVFTSIGEPLPSSEEIRIYPTLNSGNVTVENHLSGDILLTVFDISGRKLLEVQVPSGISVIDLGRDKTGFFQVRASDMDRATLGVYRVIVLR